MDEDKREDLKSGSTLVRVSDKPSRDAKCFITYCTDDAAPKDKKQLEVFNSRNKPAPRLLEYKGRDYIRTGVSEPRPDFSPKLGNAVLITHTDDTLYREAIRKIKVAEGTRGEFKGDATEHAELVEKLKGFVKKQDKPVLVFFDPGAHKLG